ncbi:unnamed protein product [Malassezia sympodialis ATCC 42132]|uniref:uncharacterized protein n=1 Tax=Malassezia sympodialis (strain ATCC 42132) TaxID=1230383 RepID=UPI0002C1D32F|nr:uncharacterized protein MSY001_1096 [Malassezia sympodialis ATCC 42132]CCU98390.1 unnamed protein product [Malassezia sympodialis ATCC 42132]|eukprot:XP_018739697.1 uncharacterized protein MSY001_1096 [Malassezia sympodialis ATCC 42132]
MDASKTPPPASDLSTSPRSIPDSPPKTRSHIALPPRSGYSLSDDSDSVRSEGDGSTGSGVSSTDSSSDNEGDSVFDEEEEDMEESQARIRHWQMARNIHRMQESSSDSRESLPNNFESYEDTSNDADAEDERDDRTRQVVTSQGFEAEDENMDGSQEAPEESVEDSLDDGLSTLEQLKDDNRGVLDSTDEEIMPRPRLSVSAFTPLLKQYDEVVDRDTAPSDEIEEVRKADLVEQGTAREKSVPLIPYDFGRDARATVLDELFENVAIAISRVEEHSDDHGSHFGSAERASFDEESAQGRMMSVNLLAAITVEGGFSSQQLVERVVPQITSWPLDPAFYVRKEVAAAIGIIGKALASGVSESFDLSKTDAPLRLLEAINRVLLDHVWQVRQAACYSLPGVFATQPADEVRRKNLVIIMQALKQDVSPNVQLAAFEMIGEIIYLFHGEEKGVPEELVRLFMGQPMHGAEASNADEMLNNLDYALIVAFNFPAVILTMGADHWPLLRELYLRLTNHVYDNIRNSLAASLHEIARLIGSEASCIDLLPVAQRFLQDPCVDVTATLLEHFDQFLLMLPASIAKEQLRQIPSLWMTSFTQDWRLRQTMASHIPSLVPELLLVDEDGSLVTLLLLALNDSVNALREIGIAAVPSMYATFQAHDETIADGFLSMLTDLARAPAYRQRVTFVQILVKLLGENLRKDRLEELIFPILLELATDRVLDVRLALSRLVQSMWKKVDPESVNPPFALNQITATLAQDTSTAIREPILALHLPISSANALPAREPQSTTLEFGPARPLLDSTSIPWRSADDNLDTRADKVDESLQGQNSSASIRMDEDSM